jgi:hypothetical protein
MKKIVRPWNPVATKNVDPLFYIIQTKGALTKMAAFCNIAACSLVEVYRRFGGA